jgi:hypothetical protein
VKTGKLKILTDYVKALPEEAKQYRWEAGEGGERRLKGAHHALDALRYLVMMLDRRGRH